jgi:hypothetical protein
MQLTHMLEGLGGMVMPQRQQSLVGVAWGGGSSREVQFKGEVWSAFRVRAFSLRACMIFTQLVRSAQHSTAAARVHQKQPACWPPPLRRRRRRRRRRRGAKRSWQTGGQPGCPGSAPKAQPH